MRRFVFIFIFIMAIFSNKPLKAQSQSILPVEVEIPFVTSPVMGNGKYHLVYEICLTNFWKKNLNLERVEIFDQEKSSLIRHIDGAELLDSLYKPKHPTDSSDVNLIECGRIGIVYVWLTFDSKNEIPDQIYHRLIFSVVDSEKKIERFVDGGVVTIPKNDPMPLSAPVKEGYWRFGSGPSNSSEHRRTLLAVDGRKWLLQRFAFDVMKIGDDGKVVRGDLSENQNWISYGEKLLAVADGIVKVVIDNIPDNKPLSPERAVPMNRETHVGNCVVLDVGNDHYALYAHMKAGSIPVRVGDKVKRGAVIGQIGNSGNSEAPHLHFSVGNTSDPYSSEGLSYVFESFDIIDVAFPNDDEFLAMGVAAEKLKIARRLKCKLEMPMGDPLIYFY
jgi:murein DD-endopeptidase